MELVGIEPTKGECKGRPGCQPQPHVFRPRRCSNDTCSTFGAGGFYIVALMRPTLPVSAYSGSSTFSVVHCGGDVEFTDGEVEHGD